MDCIVFRAKAGIQFKHGKSTRPISTCSSLPVVYEESTFNDTDSDYVELEARLGKDKRCAAQPKNPDQEDAHEDAHSEVHTLMLWDVRATQDLGCINDEASDDKRKASFVHRKNFGFRSRGTCTAHAESTTDREFPEPCDAQQVRPVNYHVPVAPPGCPPTTSRGTRPRCPCRPSRQEVVVEDLPSLPSSAVRRVGQLRAYRELTE
eukprot:gnl/TRDRNA2_/TRDRNA2_56286_c0_seq1.p1 gnl/TRDRNA2_/TRDRNA2_56286_c0~~gnl/TRDRNA2_/TRDRNA2_56286_c0_seq1.p1  ORF type:complete len:223 (+),score=20.58 gnl/TRDRNA2_/TRDRNA2_56286_c0_seq1:52-669(+)